MVGERYAELGGVPGEQEGSDHNVGVKRATTLAEETPPPTAAPVCRCGKTGFVTVISDAETKEYLGTDRLDYPGRAVTESVYPCPVCRPEQFLRYQEGCFKPGHDRDNCERCILAGVVPGKKPPKL